MEDEICWNPTPGPITFEFDDPPPTNKVVWPPQIRALGVVMTNYCPIACRHCYNESSPKKAVKLQLDRLRDFVELLSTNGHPLQAIGLSGGEAVHHPEFSAAARHFSSKQLRVSCYTSGFGLDQTALRSMAQAGVSEIVFSSDSYHEVFLTQEKLLCLVREASKIFERTTVKITVSTQQEGWRRARSLKERLPSNVALVVQPVLHIGRAVNNTGLAEKPWTFDSAPAKNCAKEFGALGINYDGKVYACCCVGSFTPGLEVGNIANISTYEEFCSHYLQNQTLRTIFATGWESGRQHKCEHCHAQMSRSCGIPKARLHPLLQVSN
ncbi:hypothetical protein A3D62_03070 [Candidatus Kaiserbacteria bacterium RIFCSPHIGHO2_02_FULL_49_11]|uniref:Uncharacterized protein n=1 Tax=Candidatus Kaiserbacteria bacterium RIFCSPHIGHO2_02_FULL_49_11 TaxID=1798489 RepID=A0A1F6D0P5_9BACT|nr:MAG: hypothetical protein A3D62_03070 [Candidatus Kaiserbacteria bacterium RIFCSPHIGHO2_02_FULL_49_11]